MRSEITVISFILYIIASVSAEARCRLNCEHGECSFVSDEQDELAILVQSGKLIEQCVCEDGYGGVACDVPIHPCQSNGKCKNGLSCQLMQDTGEYSCECSDADRVSMFAGMMCRHPYTEYCADKYDPDEATSFCTNGGKCKSSFISAQVAPGNTTVNNEYRHLGCVCPKEFYGPHCEFLKYDRHTLSDGNAETNEDQVQTTNNSEGDGNEPSDSLPSIHPEETNKLRGLPMIAGLSSVAFIIIVLGLFGRRRRMAKQEVFSDELHLHAPNVGHGYPPQYADSDVSYGQGHFYPNHQCQSPAMNLQASNSPYDDGDDDDVHRRGQGGLHREEDGLERSSTYRSTRRQNSPLYTDYETNNRLHDRQYHGYREDEPEPSNNDWSSSGGSRNKILWVKQSHSHGYHFQ